MHNLGEREDIEAVRLSLALNSAICRLNGIKPTAFEELFTLLQTCTHIVLLHPQTSLRFTLPNEF